MSAGTVHREEGQGRKGGGTDTHAASGEGRSEEAGGSLMRFARMLMRRKPVVILVILSICLILTVMYSWQLVRNGDVSGLVLVGANLCAFVIALVYLADDLLRR